MKFCQRCGTQAQDYFTSCPQCGSMLPAVTGYAYPPQQPVYTQPPVYAAPSTVTTKGVWFGWKLLLYAFPVIGHIIMICCSRDKTARNYAIAQLILLFILTLLMVVGFIWFADSFRF